MGLSPSSRAMAGNAVFRMVASSDCMKKPMATSHSNRSLWGALLCMAGVSPMGNSEAQKQKSRWAAAA